MTKKTVFITFMAVLISMLAFSIVNNQLSAAEVNNSPSDRESLKVVDLHYYGNFVVDILPRPFTKDIPYSVRGNYSKRATKVEIVKAKKLRDLIKYYPCNWIENYTSVQIVFRTDDVEKRTYSENELLTAEQIALLGDIDLFTEIDIIVKFKTQNAVTETFDDKEMRYSLTVVPEVEAEYIGGYDEMIDFLKQNSSDKIQEWDLMRVENSSISFTINEQGIVENVELLKSSGDEEVDDLLRKLIYKMPNWKPAENENGMKIKQDFVFNLGMDGC